MMPLLSCGNGSIGDGVQRDFAGARQVPELTQPPLQKRGLNSFGS
jgi:hypothetical protein